jgi:hypothetical protein
VLKTVFAAHSRQNRLPLEELAAAIFFAAQRLAAALQRPLATAAQGLCEPRNPGR